MNWDGQARLAAEHAYKHNFSSHRGTMHWHGRNIVAVFGNDGYATDERSQREVALLPGRAKVLGFGTGGDGYTWATIVETDRDQDWLDAMVKECWGVAASAEN